MSKKEFTIKDSKKEKTIIIQTHIQLLAEIIQILGRDHILSILIISIIRIKAN